MIGKLRKVQWDPNWVLDLDSIRARPILEGYNPTIRYIFYSVYKI